jgi:GxxExxY protein
MRRVRECHEALLESAVTQRVIGGFFTVFNELGYGYLESVYQRALAVELAKRGLHVQVQAPVEVTYDGVVVGAFRADIVVEARVVLELKSGRALAPEHEMQLLNYLKATEMEVGLLLHFGPKPRFRRLVWTNRSRPRSNLPRSARSAESAFRRLGRITRTSTTAAPPPSPDRHPVPPPAAYPTP